MSDDWSGSWIGTFLSSIREWHYLVAGVAVGVVVGIVVGLVLALRTLHRYDEVADG